MLAKVGHNLIVQRVRRFTEHGAAGAGGAEAGGAAAAMVFGEGRERQEACSLKVNRALEQDMYFFEF